MSDFYTYNFYELKDFGKCNKSRVPSSEYVYLKIGDNEELCFSNFYYIDVRLNCFYDYHTKEHKYSITFHSGNRAVKHEFFKLDIIDYKTYTDYYNPFLEDSDYFIPIDHICGTCIINEKETSFDITFLFSSEYFIFKKKETNFKKICIYEFYEKTKSTLPLKSEFNPKYQRIYELLKYSMYDANKKNALLDTNLNSCDSENESDLKEEDILIDLSIFINEDDDDDDI